MGGIGPTPNLVWVQNGIQVDDTDPRITVTNTVFAGSDRLESTLQIMNFQLSDAAVYQCIATDTAASGEIITSTPYQLDAGTDVLENFVFSLIPPGPPLQPHSQAFTPASFPCLYPSLIPRPPLQLPFITCNKAGWRPVAASPTHTKNAFS